MLLCKAEIRVGLVVAAVCVAGLPGQRSRTLDLVARLVERIGDSSSAYEVCDQLERMGSVAVEALIPVLGEPNAYLEQEQRALNAAYVLGRMRRGAVAAVESLVELAVNEGQGRVQHQALWALGEILPWASESVREVARSRLRQGFDGIELTELDVVLHRIDLGRPAPTASLRQSLQAGGPMRTAALRTISQGLAESSEDLAADLDHLGLEVPDLTTELGAIDGLLRNRLPAWGVDHAEACLMTKRGAAWDVVAPIAATRLMSWDPRVVEHALVQIEGKPIARGLALLLTHVLQTRGDESRLRCLELLSRDVRAAVSSYFVVDALSSIEGAVGEASRELRVRMKLRIDGLDAAVAAVRQPAASARIWSPEGSHLVLDLLMGGILAGEIPLGEKAARTMESLDLSVPEVFVRVCRIYECLDNAGCESLLRFMRSATVRLPRAADPAAEFLEVVQRRGGFAMADGILAKIVLFDGAADGEVIRVLETRELPLRMRAMVVVAERSRVVGLGQVENLLVEGMRCDGEWQSGNFVRRLPNRRTHAFRFVSAVACLRHGLGDEDHASQLVEEFLNEHDTGGPWSGHERLSEAWFREVLAVGVAVWEEAR